MGLKILDGKFQGLMARAVVVIDETGVVRRSELVNEVANEPDYGEALKALCIVAKNC